MITKEQFIEYYKVQASGQFNMFDPNARGMTSLNSEQWIAIMQNYENLHNKYMSTTSK